VDCEATAEFFQEQVNYTADNNEFGHKILYFMAVWISAHIF